MSGRDGTGPNGKGPLTGRGLGSCGGGFGFRREPELRNTYANSTKEEQKNTLREKLKELETEKHGVEKRLKELD